MKPLSLSDDERSFRSLEHALALDEQDQEILIGLTREESEWLIQDRRGWFEQRRSGTRSREAKRRHKALTEKHRVARLKALRLLTARPEGSA